MMRNSFARARKNGSSRRAIYSKKAEHLVEIKRLLASNVKGTRRKYGLSQIDLAQRLGSSQSRIAKVEAGDPSVSLDLMVRAFLATGATTEELGHLFAPGKRVS